MIEPPQTRPASSFDEAVLRARAVMARDDDTIAPVAHTRLLEHGERRPLAVALFHGLTNHPGQYVALAPELHARGANVYVPRMPYQGYKDRMTNALAALTAEELIAASYDAVDIARGLGERVAVLGISAGGLQCAYLAQYRDDVAVSVPVAPDFAILQLPYGLSKTLGWLMLHVPNLFLWWDPRIREAQRPKTAYPRFPTHALAQTLRIGDAVSGAARRTKPLAQQITTVVNRADPAVNNEAAEAVVSEWQGMRKDGIAYIELRNLPENHDIIDPDNPDAATDLVYPKLIAALGL
ncbi:MAG: alpha/beta fold hydrolase [Candidatus Eremiobacteraeota bacterium]|nr:alpha/beta fold hydrolase [Candidatus Eremiobacteraeota bacterium]